LAGKRIDGLTGHTVQGIREALNAVVDDVAVRAAIVLAEKGNWMWLFQAATEDLRA
jgi:hypothetical protein